MEKKEAAEQIKKIGPMKILRGYNKLCRRCKILSVKSVQNGTQDTVFEKYCDRCKRMLENIK